MDTNPSENRLADFEDRPRARHSGRKMAMFMQYFKIVLIVVGVVLAVITFTWTSFTQDDFLQVPTEDIVRAVQKNELLEARFDSVDDKGQPFTITAERAVRGDGETIILDEPSGDIELTSGRWLSARAEQGFYNQDKQRLVLRDAVQIFDSEGYTVESQHMAIHLDENIVLSESDVYGQGPAGTIHSTGLYSNIDNGLLSFTGPARLVLFTHDAGAGLGGLR